MELIGGIILVGVLVLAPLVGWWARRHPAPSHDVPDEAGISEREWMDAIK